MANQNENFKESEQAGFKKKVFRKDHFYAVNQVIEKGRE